MTKNSYVSAFGCNRGCGKLGFFETFLVKSLPDGNPRYQALLMKGSNRVPLRKPRAAERALTQREACWARENVPPCSRRTCLHRRYPRCRCFVVRVLAYKDPSRLTLLRVEEFGQFGPRIFAFPDLEKANSEYIGKLCAAS